VPKLGFNPTKVNKKGQIPTYIVKYLSNFTSIYKKTAKCLL